MRLNRVRRFGVIGAVLASMLGALVVFAPSSAAATPWMCQGQQLELERCVTVWYNPEYGTYRARATMTDIEGGRDFRVWVNDVKLLHRVGPGKYEVVRSEPDRDGWFGVKDVAATKTVHPCNFKDPVFRVKATFYWRGAASGQTTFYPESVSVADFCD